MAIYPYTGHFNPASNPAEIINPPGVSFLPPSPPRSGTFCYESLELQNTDESRRSRNAFAENSLAFIINHARFLRFPTVNLERNEVSSELFPDFRCASCLGAPWRRRTHITCKYKYLPLHLGQIRCRSVHQLILPPCDSRWFCRTHEKKKR